MEKRTESEILSKAPIKVKLGEKDYITFEQEAAAPA